MIHDLVGIISAYNDEGLILTDKVIHLLRDIISNGIDSSCNLLLKCLKQQPAKTIYCFKV